ncbi:hypothetical protein K227x_50490 [Rubripirellula lacrimiformis]|uniref:Secreted protein n=1 Tax=Rubripirellula lacrimiformis TaxID=1930273 RepID=A0A517NHV0_9BACT|nr:hypothetical protein [Rubripirellula lacrimiformis]QDT06633.1 hypothetical protein K227x_50490 [Rubripirellula lacrimiformis]
MKQLLSLAFLAACFSFSLTGCGGSGPEVVAPEAAEESVELTAAEQAEYDKEMAAQMGN